MSRLHVPDAILRVDRTSITGRQRMRLFRILSQWMRWNRFQILCGRFARRRVTEVCPRMPYGFVADPSCWLYDMPTEDECGIRIQYPGYA